MRRDGLIRQHEGPHLSRSIAVTFCLLGPKLLLQRSASVSAAVLPDGIVLDQSQIHKFTACVPPPVRFRGFKPTTVDPRTYQLVPNDGIQA
jgi:hypothetical protein